MTGRKWRDPARQAAGVTWLTLFGPHQGAPRPDGDLDTSIDYSAARLDDLFNLVIVRRIIYRGGGRSDRTRRYDFLPGLHSDIR